MNKFEGLGLSQPTLDAILALGFETPTQIQQEAIPKLLKNNQDFIGLAQTGTGKTAAFGLPLMDLVDANVKHTQALIMAPTRELCVQITAQIESFAKFQKGLKTLAVYGGADIRRQMTALKKGVHVIIATPGRLKDLLKRKAANLSKIDYVVLDEADEMLNMGFREEIDIILEGTPVEKKVWLFSATMSKDVTRISKNYMKKPEKVVIGDQNTSNKNISHFFTLVRPKERYEALKRYLSTEKEVYGIVFCRTRRDTKELADKLTASKFKADAINGDLSQSQRDRVMDRFKSKKVRILVATDVAARGIDVDNITHVFHYNIPEDIDFYTHRSGRTGRAGNKGVSLILAHPKDKRILKVLEKRINSTIEFKPVPSGKAVIKVQLERVFEGIKKAKQVPEVEGLIEDLEKSISNLTKEELVRQIAYFTMRNRAMPAEFKAYSKKEAAEMDDKPYKKNRGKKNPYHKKKARRKFERSRKSRRR